jgi:hypothetical protein
MRTLFLTTAAFAALVMIAPIGNAYAASRDASLEREYAKLTEKCQGGRWNAETKLVCQRRDELGYKLGR